MRSLGKKNWIIPDCELPEEGEGVLKGHESVVIVNDGESDAHIDVTVFYTDMPCYNGISWMVKAKSVRCFRLNDERDMCGYRIPLNTQYALKIVSDARVVIQYGRLDNRQTNLAYYTTLGYCEEE